MRLTDFDVYRDLLREKSGTLITPDKTALLDSRLGPVAKRWGYPSVEAMTLVLKAVPDKQLVSDVVEAMFDHKTCFFQTPHFFETLKTDIFPWLAKNLSTYEKIKLWSLGCATGQEAYSLAILLKEYGGRFAEGGIEILATDMSHQALVRAQDGIYSQYEIQRGLPIRLALKYFTQKDEKWRINTALRKMVRFEHLSLLSNMDKLGDFNIIFCQNVLNNLDPKIKEKTLENLALRLAPYGFLFVNDVTDVTSMTNRLAELPGKTGIYARINSPALEKNA